MLGNCEKEILELHRFFENWFNAEIPDNEEPFSRIKESLSPEFKMITPGGEKIDRDSLLSNLRSMNGFYQKAAQPSAIWVKNISHEWVKDTYSISNYEEWQGSKNRTEAKGRISSVLFEKHDAAPNGVRWVYLHETWIT